MNSKLLSFIDGIVNDRLTLLEERKIDSFWKNENEDLKASTEEEIKLCNEFLNESLKMLRLRLILLIPYRI